MSWKNGWYTADKLFATKQAFAMVCGTRTGGKTTSIGFELLRRYIEFDEQFMIVTRYDSDKAYATDIFPSIVENYFELNKFYGYERPKRFPKEIIYNKKTFDYEMKFGLSPEDRADEEGEQCGFFVALNTIIKAKRSSARFNRVKYIFMDEFLPEDNVYIRSNQKGEAEELFRCYSLYETVARGFGSNLRSDVKFIFAGNRVSYDNPYFMQMKANDGHTLLFHMLLRDQQGAKDYSISGAGWYFEIFTAERDIAETPFGRLITGTAYGDYSLSNVPYKDAMGNVLDYRPTIDFDKPLYVINNIAIYQTTLPLDYEIKKFHSYIRAGSVIFYAVKLKKGTSVSLEEMSALRAMITPVEVWLRVFFEDLETKLLLAEMFDVSAKLLLVS